MDTRHGGILTRQPGKSLWALFAITLNAMRLPFWLIYYLPSFLRQHPKWSHRQAVRVAVVKAFLWNVSVIEMKTPLSLEPKAEKERWAVASPAQQKYYTGVTTADPDILPEPVGGTWYPSQPGVSVKPGYVVLHFHGGAYVIGDGRTQDAGFAARTMIENTDASHVFAPQYRISSNPGCRFPAALQDAVTSYVYLVVNQGIAPNKIILSGDSAGANLALSLVRYLADHGSSIGLSHPVCAWLWSPWASPVKSLTTETFDRSPNVPTDYVNGAFGVWGATSYQPSPKSGLTLHHPNITFLDNAFATPTPIYISTGECEVLFHDDVKLAEQMKAVKGNRVTLQVEEHSVHDTILVGKLIGFEAEAQLAARRAGEFLRSVYLNGKL